MNTNIALNNEANRIAADIDSGEVHAGAYEEGAFFADTDWTWALKEKNAACRPSSMAEHCAMAWAFVAGSVCPEWNNEHARLSFLLGYEDRATELADIGEAGYEALAEAGTVADTEGWMLQGKPWAARVSSREKALRAIRAAWAGAAAWQARAEETGAAGDRYRAEEALIRAKYAGDCGRAPAYVAEAAMIAH
ncbi:hypothetical protein CI15_18980 [Paraburkholderia monticola]|uniref:Uncharacterized protein n=1 Tax=Paraburkholderia monticola TaxID=1399968 RepID=A0A149PND2_9BURK|nr:hypothetical protein [Paraburkholderia monticola]KXU86522.1 hypothetical protein CI15_18980 [Paraburkholderia monticola]